MLYYNAETRKILISRNFRFLEPSNTTPEHLVITPDNEGESRSALDIVTRMPGESLGRSLNPLKHRAEDNINGSLRRTRGRRIDYKHLSDPWQDNETMLANEITNLLEGDDDQLTLKQAKQSLEWPVLRCCSYTRTASRSNNLEGLGLSERGRGRGSPHRLNRRLE